MTPPADTSERADSIRPRTGRAAPMSAPERRAAIIEATIPLLLVRGTAVTTRELAQAACVAEGTLFSVFSDKDALIAEAVEAALDPHPTADAVAAIDHTLPLEERLSAAIQVVQDRLAAVGILLNAVGPRPEAQARPPGDRPAELYTGALATLFEPDRDRLDQSPADCARALFALTMGGSHAVVVGDHPMAATEIVNLVLHGVLAQSGRAPHLPSNGDRP